MKNFQQLQNLFENFVDRTRNIKQRMTDYLSLVSGGRNNSRRDNIFTSLSLIINTSFVLGIIPIYWDPTSKAAKLISSKFSIIRWKITLLLIILTQISLVTVLMHQILVSGLSAQFSTIYLITQFVTTISSGVFLPFHLHTALHARQMVQLLNGLLVFWEQISDIYLGSTRRLKYEKSASLILQFVHLCFFTSILTSGSTYAVRCSFHMLSPIITVCPNLDEHPYTWWYKHPLMWVTMHLLQLYWVWIISGAIFIFTSTAILGVIFTNIGIKQLSLKKETLMANDLESQNQWLQTYRSIQILIQCFNSIYSSSTLPYLLIGFIGAAIVLLPAAIRLDNQLVKVGFIYGYFISLNIIFGFVHYGAQINSGWKEFIVNKSLRSFLYRRNDYQSSYWKRIHSTCINSASFRIKIGNFGYLQASSSSIIGTMLLESSCTILLEI